LHGDSLTQRESWCEWIHATLFFIYNKEERRREKGRKGEREKTKEVSEEGKRKKKRKQ